MPAQLMSLSIKVITLFALLCSNHAMAQWTALNSGVANPLYSVHFVDQNTGFAVGTVGMILKTTDGGATWNTISSGTFEALRSVHFWDSLTGYIAGDNTIFKTTDGGTTWIDITPVSEYYSDIYTPDEFIVYAVAASGKVYKSVNQGIAWTPSATLQFTPELKSIHMATPDTGFVIGSLISSGPMYKTSDAGATWTYVDFAGAAGGDTQFDIFMPNSSTVYGVGGALNPTGKKSFDFGTSWTDITFFGDVKTTHFLSSSSGYIAGFNGHIYYTSDSANTFCIQSSSTSQRFRDIFFIDDTTGFAVGDLGTIVKTANGGFGCPSAVMLPQTDTTVCIGSTINFTGLTTGTQSHNWLEDGVSFSSLQSPSRTFNTAGAFTISYVVGKSCEGCFNDTVNMVVTVNPLPVADAGLNDSICQGDSAMLNASGGTFYSWTPTTGLSNPNIANPNASPTSTTNYLVTVSDSIGCSDVASVNIKVNDIPTITVTPDTLIICAGDSGTLVANPQAGSFVYAWFNQSFDSVGTGNSLVVDTAGKYYAVNINMTTGCYNVDSSEVVLQSFNSAASASICSGDSILLGGMYQTLAGTYYDSLSSILGCDSVIVTTLAVQSSSASTQTITACDTFLWNGNPYTLTGMYSDTIPNVAGCDSIMTLNLTVGNSSFATQTVTACDSFEWNSVIYVTSGTYMDTVPNVAGCDSVMTLNLTVYNSTSSTQTVNACDSYIWNSNTYTVSGTYVDTIPNVSGCDSVMTLNLTVNYSSSSSQNATACDSYIWNFNTYTASGTYFDTIPNVMGCDSVLALNLTISNSSSSSETAVSCGSYLWNFNTYSVSGTYTDTLPNAAGCDSIMTLNLTIGQNSASSQSVTACDSYVWNSNTYTLSGTYMDTIPNASGCDSIMTLNLAINSSPTVSIYAVSGPTTFCQGGSVSVMVNPGGLSNLWSTGETTDGITISTAGVYSVIATDFNGCSGTDSVLITVNPLPTVSLVMSVDSVCSTDSDFDFGTPGTPGGGTYSGTGVVPSSAIFSPSDAGVGLHTITYAYTDGNGCTDSATAQMYVGVCSGVSTLSDNDYSIRIVPNPNSGIFRLEVEKDLSGIVRIYNMSGGLVYESKFNNSEIDLSKQSSGTYILELSSGGKVVYQQKIVKE